MEQKKVKRQRKGKIAVAFFLVLVLALSPCSAFFGENGTAKAATFTIRKLKDSSIIKNGNFAFYGSPLRSDLLYWIKNDETPLFCVEREKHLLANLDGTEISEEFGQSQYLDEEEYELVSLVLQCCGMIRGEKIKLHPGVYVAGQAAVWGITSSSWRGVEHFRTEMEKVYAHIEDWYEFPGEEILAQCQTAVEQICETITAYYGDESPYVPSFASKYKEKAPVWAVSMEQDQSCHITFGLDGKSEAIKDFVFQMPEGWNYTWQGDNVLFYSENAQEGRISVTGRAKEGTLLDKAMPIGLVHIVGPKNYSFFQRLASAVECKTNWSCYFQLQIEKPEDPGSWHLPEVYHYRHQETFHALYGAALKKLDGDTMEAIPGVVFQPLEYFDAGQLEETVLDKQQIKTWNGWKANCSPEVTDEDGYLEHWDKREYHYEKTYCSGHPEPEIHYQGENQEQRERLEQEAQTAWEEEIEECSRKCDFHSIDGSGAEMMEADRDLAYQQFIHLIYGYTFQETEPASGYLPHGKHEGDKEIEKIFLTSLQAGGREERIQLSTYKVRKVQAFHKKAASSSDAEPIEKEEEEGKRIVHEKDEISKENKTEEKKDEENMAEPEGSERNGDGLAGNGTDEIGEAEEIGAAEKKIDLAKEEEDKTEQASDEDGERIKKLRRLRRENFIWLTSSIKMIEPQETDDAQLYLFLVKNFKEPPEETTPEETQPEESSPEETTPEETQPEESSPEETTPEETQPEESSPEETTPEETQPEESSPQETTPEETRPEESSPQETTPEETQPEESSPEETPPEETIPEETSPKETLPETSAPPPPPPGRPGGGRRKIENPQPSLPEETVGFFLVEEELVPQAFSRMGWIEAEYATPSAALDRRGRKNQGSSPDSLPETGDQGASVLILALFCAGSGILLIWMLKRRRKTRAVFFFLFFSLAWGYSTQAAELERIKPKQENSIPEKLIREQEELSLQEQGIRAADNKLIFYFSTEEVSGEYGEKDRRQTESIQQEKSVQQEKDSKREEYAKEGQESERRKEGQGVDESGRGGIREMITDENGQRYWLESCCPVWHTLPEKEEWISESVLYQAVENDGQIPENLWFQAEDKEEGRYGEGELFKTSVTLLHTYWNSGFWIPLRFCDYDAETYRLEEMEVPKEQALVYLLEHQQGLLEAVGCAPEAYQLDAVDWNGESYFVDGVSYRDAVAYGKKRVSDCLVEYTGEVIYPEQTLERWEAVYAPEILDTVQQVLDETQVQIAEPAEEETETTAVFPAVQPEEKTFSWKVFWSIAAYSVSLAVFLPFLVYIFFLARHRKKTLAHKGAEGG